MRAGIHIALLRAVNVGGRGKIAMGDLREMLGHLGFRDARSVLQSGNLVFGTDGWTGEQLEDFLEIEAEKRLGLRTDFFVRTPQEWATIVAGNPFGKEAGGDPSHLVVMVLKEAPDPARVGALQASISGPEVIRALGRHAYIYYPDGIGRSRLTNSLIEKKLGARGTARNWNTVLRLENLAAGGESSD